MSESTIVCGCCTVKGREMKQMVPKVWHMVVIMTGPLLAGFLELQSLGC